MLKIRILESLVALFIILVAIVRKKEEEMFDQCPKLHFSLEAQPEIQFLN